MMHPHRVEQVEFIYPRRAALLLSCTQKHVYDLIRMGEIEALRVGRRGLRVSRQSLENFIKRRKIDPVEYFD